MTNADQTDSNWPWYKTISTTFKHSNRLLFLKHTIKDLHPVQTWWRPSSTEWRYCGAGVTVCWKKKKLFFKVFKRLHEKLIKDPFNKTFIGFLLELLNVFLWEIFKNSFQKLIYGFLSKVFICHVFLQKLLQKFLHGFFFRKSSTDSLRNSSKVLFRNSSRDSFKNFLWRLHQKFFMR